MSEAVPQVVTTAITFTDILKFAATTGIITAVFNAAFAWIREAVTQTRAERPKRVKLAMEIVHELEIYADECKHFYQLNDYRMHEGGGHTEVKMPVLTMPKIEDWHGLAVSSAMDLRRLEARIKSAHHSISATWEVEADHESAAMTASERARECGGAALALANRIRQRNKLGDNGVAFEELRPDGLTR